MKKLFITGVAAIVCAAMASADVVGWWRFNGEGANVPNVAATAGLPDGTPRATDGTIISIDTYGANPVYGSTATSSRSRRASSIRIPAPFMRAARRFILEMTDSTAAL